jgi:hypothetical protein
MNYRNHLIALILSLGTLTLQGQQMTDSKTFMKSFRAGDDAVVEVTNKYGNIHISHGNADSISVRVEVTASSDKESKLSSMMADVDISITMTNETVRAQTSFNKGVTPLLESLKGLTRNIINYGSRLKIDYFIECPPSTVLRLTNSYGDVYIGDETPELTLKLSNGSLDAGVIKNAEHMELTFCKANVRSITEGRIILSFSELRTKGTENINLTSVSSKVWIDSCGTVDIDSKSDDINLGSVSVITGITHFSDINVENITKELSLMMKYGNLSCEKVDLFLPEKANYDLEIRHTNAFVSLSGITPEPERTTVNDEDKIYITSGRYGSSHDSSKIRIEATRGEIRIVQR